MLLHEKDQYFNKILARSINIIVMVLIIFESLGSHILDNGFYIYCVWADWDKDRDDYDNDFYEYLHRAGPLFKFDDLCVWCNHILHFFIGCILLLIYYKLGSNEPLFNDL